ncbi:hypothetical protein [Cesiribacter andamanensis]|nr:hypothetical protein [Cesiribacter andamanensis]
MITTGVAKGYRWVQALSLDVALGSGLLSLAIARYYQVALPGLAVLALMLAVWVIYTFDHLSDARKLKTAAATYRHRFHQQHYRLLCRLLLLAVALGLGLASQLPESVLRWGLVCTALVGVYFWLLQVYAFRYKELLVSACYTLGVFLAPLSLVSHPLTPIQLLLIPQIFLLALSNLLIFSYFEYQTDRQDGHFSLALHFGGLPIKRLTLALVSIGLLLCGLLYAAASLLISREVQLLLFSMNLLLLLLLLKEALFRKHERYRIIGDGIFFIPALLLLYAW